MSILYVHTTQFKAQIKYVQNKYIKQKKLYQNFQIHEK